MSFDNSLGEAGDRISNMVTRYVSAGASTRKVCACDYECIRIREKEIPLYIYSECTLYRKHGPTVCFMSFCREGNYKAHLFMTVLIIKPQRMKTTNCSVMLYKLAEAQPGIASAA